MIKEILIGVAACALVASPAAFAQSTDNGWEAAPKTPGPYGQDYNNGNIVRIEEFNEGPVEAVNEVVELQVPQAALERLAGKYTARDKSVIVVTRAGNRLAVDISGLSLEFAPSGPNEFFIQGGPLTLSFVQGEAGKAQGLVVRENGTVIMQATVAH